MTKHVSRDAIAAAMAVLPYSPHDLACRDAVDVGVRYVEELGPDLLHLLENDLPARDRARNFLEAWRNFQPLDLQQYRALRATVRTLDRLDNEAQLKLKRARIRPAQPDDPVVVDGDRDRLREHFDRLADACGMTRNWLVERGVALSKANVV